MMFDRLDIVAAAIVISGPAGVLLGRRGLEQSHPGMWCNMGGRTEAWDRDPWEAARRELAEESGIKLLPSHKVDQVMVHQIPPSSPVKGYIAVYYVSGVTQDPEIQGPEIEAFRWFNPASVVSSPGANRPHFFLQPGTEIQLSHLLATTRNGYA